MKFINPATLAKPGGHYSPGVSANGFVFISGQLPINGEGVRINGTIEEQTLQVLKNLQAIMEDAGGSIQDIVKCTIYISDGEYWGPVNKVYADFFGAHKPARAIVPVKDLHYGFLIELEAIGLVGAE